MSAPNPEANAGYNSVVDPWGDKWDRKHCTLKGCPKSGKKKKLVTVFNKESNVRRSIKQTRISQI